MISWTNDRPYVQPNGIEKVLPIGKLSDYEKTLLKGALPELSGSIASASSLSSFLASDWETVS